MRVMTLHARFLRNPIVGLEFHHLLLIMAFVTDIRHWLDQQSFLGGLVRVVATATFAINHWIVLELGFLH